VEHLNKWMTLYERLVGSKLAPRVYWLDPAVNVIGQFGVGQSSNQLFYLANMVVLCLYEIGGDGSAPDCA
jgi:hypothetical protein